MTEFLRTPDENFKDLDDFPYQANYHNWKDMRMHYVDEGPTDAPVMLLIHGMPTWSFLYRHVIPKLVAAGYRCIAPDHLGFGKSDKPTDPDWYTIARHTEVLTSLITSLDLKDITLVCQDWGGLIGLRLVAAEPQRFARVVTSNTMLPTGDHDPGEAFMKWQRFSQEVPVFPTGKIINGGTVTELPDEVLAAYNAPFPDESYKEGARQFPLLVPTTPDNPESQANRDAWKALMEFEKPWLCAFGDSDPITGAAAPIIQKLVPGCQGQPHTTLRGGGHFIQEDCGEELARVVLDWLRK